MTNRQLDERDRKLLALLENNARAPVTELSRALNLSRNAVQQRMNRLEKLGVIKGYTVVRRDPDTSALRAVVMIQMHDARQNCPKLAMELREWPEIRSCHSVAGEEDVNLMVQADTMDQMNDLLIRLSEHDRVRHIRSYMILDTAFER